MRDATAHISREPTWHLLQVSDALDEEFGSALAELVHLMAWTPERHYFPHFRQPLRKGICELKDPCLTMHTFPLLRGFARFPWSALERTDRKVSRHLLRYTEEPELSPLICTSPYYAPVAELWPGPVIYWLTDMMASYNGANAEAVRRLDTRMCRVATMVCPNSARLADYLTTHTGCPSSRLRILPNATRASNLFATPPNGPSALPKDAEDLARPVAGVIGNLAGNMDWVFLERVVSLTPDMSWLFVGPTTMAIADPIHSKARARVMGQPNARFVGKKPYGALAGYARAFDVAVLPYRRCEPTYSGSSTRFYEHLAACRPMIATRGFEELLHKEPLLRLVDTSLEAVGILRDLEASGFDDGMMRLRWSASREGTWQMRAACMVTELGKLCDLEPVRAA